VPFTRTQLVDPGTRKIRLTRSSRMILRRESSRWLPLQSGKSSVSSSAIVTTGPRSPRGLPSVPSGPTVDRMQNRLCAIQSR
jgi:hypothetical protein